MMRVRRFAVSSVLVLLCWALSTMPALAQGVGAIGGTVLDSSGGVLPGATVTLASAQGTLGGSRDAVTDERGTYQFTRLVPGTYSVKAELSGFRSTTQENIVVNADATARVDLKLEVGSLSEGITVTGEAPLIDTTTALAQTVLSREVLDSMPNRSDVWAVARVIASVTLSKVDVGGSEAFLQSSATVHGSSNENGYLIDGMDVSSLDGNGTIATMYLDPYAFQETNYQTANGAAERSRGGLIFNMVTKTGTNQLRGGFMFNGANHGMGYKNYSPALKAQLLAAVPAAALAANPNILPGADILSIYDIGAYLAGPIVRDKLWFSGSWHRQILNQYVLGSYDSNGKQVLDDNLMWTTAAKLSWQINRDTQLSYFNNLQYKLIGHRSGGGTYADSAARNYNDKYPDVHQLKLTRTIGSKMVFDMSGSRFRADDNFGKRPEVKDGDISRYDSVTATYTVALPTYRDAKMSRSVFLTSLSFYNGSHDLKLGYQYLLAGMDQITVSSSGMRAVYRNGVPDSVNTYNTPVGYSNRDSEHGVYIQDRWTPVRKLALTMGLRYETNNGWQFASCQATTQFVQGRCFEAIKGAPDFKNIAPRLSVVYDVLGDGRLALKAAVNRYNRPIGLEIVQRVNPIATVSDTRTWKDANGDLIPQLEELGPSTGFSFGVTNRYADDLQRPVSNEYSVEIQRQLPGNMVVSTGFTHRETRRQIGSKNLAVPAEGYIPLAVTEATSGRAVTVYNQDPATRNKFDTLWDNFPQLDSNYNGGDITLNKRLSNHWSFTGGVSFGKTTGDIYGTSDLNNPNYTFREGIVGNDVPFSLRLSGMYQLPYGVSVSATMQHNEGFPENTTVSVGSNTVALTQVTQSLVVEPRATTRLPAVNSLDVSIRKSWKMGARSFEPRLDLYNLLNAATILGRITQLGPTYQRVSSIQRGRLIRAGFTVDF
jgi:hypothetical protein